MPWVLCGVTIGPVAIRARRRDQIYLAVLAQAESDRRLYLAVPHRVYENLLSEKFGHLIVTELELRRKNSLPLGSRLKTLCWDFSRSGSGSTPGLRWGEAGQATRVRRNRLISEPLGIAGDVAIQAQKVRIDRIGVIRERGGAPGIRAQLAQQFSRSCLL